MGVTQSPRDLEKSQCDATGGAGERACGTEWRGARNAPTCRPRSASRAAAVMPTDWAALAGPRAPPAAPSMGIRGGQVAWELAGPRPPPCPLSPDKPRESLGMSIIGYRDL